jgi:hypothetical protein
LIGLEVGFSALKIVASFVVVGLGNDVKVGKNVQQVILGWGQFRLDTIFEDKSTKTFFQASKFFGIKFVRTFLKIDATSADEMDEVISIRIGGGRELTNLFQNETLAAILISNAIKAVDDNENMSLFVSSIPKEFLALEERKCKKKKKKNVQFWLKIKLW